MLIDFILLVFLFIILAFSADVAVKHIKFIAGVLGIRLFAFGILLGIITSLPELSVGINSQIDHVASLAVGNLLGGIMVIFGLILGGSLLLNREIKTDGAYSTLIPETILIFLPLLLGFDGSFGLFDGILMILSYLSLVFYLYKKNQHFSISIPQITERDKITKSFLLSFLSVVSVLMTSHFIVEKTLNILQNFNISGLVVGILVFAIGTNLPEITIALTSWRKKAGELSLNHLISSAFTNTFILGILSFINKINFELDLNYFLLVIFMSIILTLFVIFYHSDKQLDRKEGFVLFMLYIIFLISSMLFS